jgi:hypothetical protein
VPSTTPEATTVMTVRRRNPSVMATPRQQVISR